MESRHPDTSHTLIEECTCTAIRKKAVKAGKAVRKMHETDFRVDRTFDKDGNVEIKYTLTVSFPQIANGIEKFVEREMQKLFGDKLIEDACLWIKSGFVPNNTLYGYKIYVHRAVPPDMIIMSPQAYDEFLRYVDENYIKYMRDSAAFGLKGIPKHQINKKEPGNLPSEVLPK